MIEHHNSGVYFALNEYALTRVAILLREANTQPTHLVMHPTVRAEYRQMVTPETPEWAKSKDGTTIYAIEARAQFVWSSNNHDYPVVTDPDAPLNEIAFWKGGEKVAVIRDVATCT